ncbi:hypothetical protein IAD21_04361 [Abditibacteriota bacterium]|nr:hypothetical protein IAD21_04361 [Abditibacteriota bacterium]
MSPYENKARLLSLKHWDADAVRELTSLTNFDIWTFEPQATFEAGVLGELTRPRQWRFLSIHDSELERGNLRALAIHSSLRRLDLKGCRFDVVDFVWLCEQLAAGACPKLTEFWLEGTPIGDEEMRALGKIERLRQLDLSGTAVSDAGLSHLLGLKNLNRLSYRNTHVSEVGIMSLAALPRLNGLNGEFFLAQIAAKKSKKPLDQVQLAVAGGRLRDFLADMEDWERAAYKRAKDIEKRYKALRPKFNEFSEAESREDEQFWLDIREQKAAIVQRYCSQKLLGRGAAFVGSYGNPPRFQRISDWIDFETPSKKKTIFYGEGRSSFNGKRRYTMILEKGEWKLDEVQWWSGGWKRDMV